MRRLGTIIIGGLFSFLLFLFLVGFDIPMEIIIAFGVFLIITLVASIEIVNYYTYQLFGIGRWIHPFIKLSIILIKLDGVERASETKRMVSYLNNEFELETAKIKLIYYKRQFKKRHNVKDIIEEINYSSNTTDKVRILQHLIKIALTDRLLSDKEKNFIENVAKRLKIPSSTLKAILNLHTYVTEEDIKHQQFNRPSASSFIESKAFQILGLEEGASFEEVKDSYRDLVKIYHPDKLLKSERNNEFAKQQFQAITDAYNLLKEKLS